MAAVDNLLRKGAWPKPRNLILAILLCNLSVLTGPFHHRRVREAPVNPNPPRHPRLKLEGSCVVDVLCRVEDVEVLAGELVPASEQVADTHCLRQPVERAAVVSLF